MVNQKGQAFSVFELMIAAIVAIAILFVLLPLVAPPEIGGNAKTEIASTLTNVETGGFSRTREFTLTPNEIVSSSNFDDKGFDATQIVFNEGEFLETKIKSATSVTSSYIQSTSKTNTPAKAMVYCSSTGEVLDTEIGLIVTEEADLADIKKDIKALCTDNDAQPCCAVVLVKK